MKNKAINELVKDAHNNAISKGWWKEERSFGEIAALIHSEVSEALEVYRSGNAPTFEWYEQINHFGLVLARSSEQIDDTWKPCGIPSELADIVIRVFDICGKRGWGELLEKNYFAMRAEHPGPNQVRKSLPFAENLSILHNWISSANQCLTENLTITFLGMLLVDTFRLAGFYRIDLEESIGEKMSYNATRTHRHGGKVI